MLNNLQVLRALAACFVVITHLTPLDRPLLADPLRFGLHGVDLFFVISGFVMVYTTSGRPVTPLEFMTNRLIRIVPLYWALTLLMYAIAFVAPSLMKGTGTGPVELLKSLFFVAFDKGGGRVQPTLFLGWTLNYEMFFYALFALSLAIPAPRLRVPAVCAVLLALVAAGSVFARGPVAAFYTAPLILEFGFGMLIGLFHERIRSHPPFPALAAVLVIGGLLPIVLHGGEDFQWRAVVVGIPAALVVVGALSLEARGWRITSPAALLLGAASYSLYLAHFFVVTVLEAFAIRHGLTSGWKLPLAALVAVAAALVTGVAVHLLYERPVDRALRHRLRLARKPAAQSDAAALWPWRRRDAPSEG